MIFLQLLFSGLTVAFIFYSLGCILAARAFFSQDAPSSTEVHPPLTILIPLCGADFGAYDGYAELCAQDYPEFQVVFGVRDPEDSSVPVVERLRAAYPERDIRLVVGDRSVGENPKVDNLARMFDHAKYEHLIVMDSDIRGGPGFLSGIAAELCEPGVGLVTCLYRAGEAPSRAALIEALGITADFAPGVLLARRLEGMTFALGAVMAVTKERLKSIGGFEALGDYLADDYMMGKLIHETGAEVKLSQQVVRTVLHPMTFKAMLAHQVRWARGIRACRPLGHLGSIATHGTVMAFFNVLASSGGDWNLLLFVAAMAARFYAVKEIGVRRLGDSIPARNLLLLPVRDCFAFWVWCLSWASNRVVWRGKVYALREKGKMCRIE